MANTNESISWNITWDAAINQPLATFDPNNNAVTFTYDANGNLLTVQNAIGAVWAYTYDAEGRRVTSTDPLGKTTTVAYDGPDLVSVTDALRRRAQFLPDPAGRPMAMVDAHTRILFDTHHNYLIVHEPTSLQLPLGRVVSR